MVRSCPTSLGFQCPVRGALFAPLEDSYGTFDPGAILGRDRILNISGLSCNYLGVDWPTLGSAGARLSGRSGMLWVVSAVLVAWMVVA
jgi:hypothetical protein